MSQFTTLLEAIDVPQQTYTPATTHVAKAVLARRINALLAANSQGFFRDTGWEHVNNIFSLLRAAGYDYELKSANYLHNDDGSMKAKVWKFVIPFQQPSGREGLLYGSLTASFSGTKADPTERYDIAAYVS